MLIGELARRTGASPRALRYYEAQDLLEAGRTPNGYRSYPPGAELRVRQIRGLLEAGFSTQTMVAILPCAQGEAPLIELCPSVVATMRATLDRIDAQLGSLHEQHEAISTLLQDTTLLPHTTLPQDTRGRAVR